MNLLRLTRCWAKSKAELKIQQKANDNIENAKQWDRFDQLISSCEKFFKIWTLSGLSEQIN